MGDAKQNYPKVFAVLKQVQFSGQNYKAICPAHEDANKSLSLKLGSEGTLMAKCHAGCSFDQIRRALNLEVRDFYPPGATMKNNGRANTPKKNTTMQSRVVKTSDYVDEQGTLLYQSIRKEPKAFFQQRPATANDNEEDRRRGFSYSLGDTRRVLYRLPELIAADPKRTVFVLEGEKDVDDAWKRGFVATCNVGGAGKWLADYNEFLRGRRVFSVPDQDPQSVNGTTKEPMFHPDGRPVRPGWDHACKVGENLKGVADFFGILWLPNLPGVKGDWFDWWTKCRGSKESLQALCKATPAWNGDLWCPVDYPLRDQGSPTRAERPAEHPQVQTIIDQVMRHPATLAAAAAPTGIGEEGQKYIRAAQEILSRVGKMSDPDFTLICRGILREFRQ